MEIVLIISIIVCLILIGMIVIKNKQIEYYQIISKNLSAMRVIQSMFEIMGASISGINKIQELNKIVIDTYKIKYSSIITFDGDKYNVQTTNVEKEYINSIVKIGNDNEFKNNVIKNISKYLTTTSDKTLTYRSAIDRNIKSCMFSPIYNGNTLIGYWLLEDDTINAFDSMSKSELSKLKNNLGVFLENAIYQNIIEIAENTDKQTGFYNNLYLYSKARNKLIEAENTAMVVLSLENLGKVNNEYSREVGNRLLAKAVEVIKELVSSTSISIRYSGAKIIILVPNATSSSVHSNVEMLLSRIKSDAIENVDGVYVSLELKMLIKTIKKQSNIENEVQNLMKYIEKMENIDTIKIVE